MRNAVARTRSSLCILRIVHRLCLLRILKARNLCVIILLTFVIVCMLALLELLESIFLTQSSDSDFP